MANHMIQELVQVVEEARKIRKHSGVEYIDWVEVSQQMAKKYPEEYNSKERWRSAYRRATSAEWREQHDRVNQRTTFKRGGATKLQSQMAVYFKSKRTLDDTKKMFNIKENDIFSEVTKMRLLGYDVHLWLEDGTTFLQIMRKVRENTKTFERLYKGREFKIALVSDTHMGQQTRQRSITYIL